jgi:hypothetical protein
VTEVVADPFGSVVTGSCLSAEDFPRHCPQLDLFGFRRYERVFVYQGIAPLWAVLSTRQGISLELLPISLWGSDHIFFSDVELRRLAYGL